jgi:hypothetical protein
MRSPFGALLRRWWPALVPATALIAAGPLVFATAEPRASGRSHAARHPRCPPAGVHLLARDRILRVYSTGAEPAATVVACRLGSGARMTLQPGPSHRFRGLHRSVGGLVLAGGLVGYEETQFGVDSGTTRVVVADVGRRRVLRSIEGGKYVDAGLIVAEGVERFVLTPGGAVAWVTTRSKRRRLTDVTVSAAPPVGNAVVLDEGLAIDPSSLRRSGSTVSWIDGGVRRTAPMPRDPPSGGNS